MANWHEIAGVGSPRHGGGAAPVRQVAVGPGSSDHVRDTFARMGDAVARSRAQRDDGRSMLSRPTGDGASAAAQRESLAVRALLRASLSAFVAQLRQERVPPEQMLVRVKALVRESMPQHVDAVEARDLMEDAVRWSIAAYYGGD